MAGGRQEVNAAVDPGVWDSPLPVDAKLFPQELLILLIDVLHYRLPAEMKLRTYMGSFPV